MSHPTTTLQLSELILKSQTEIAQIFSTLPSAKNDDLAGRAWEGKLFATMAVEKMPEAINKQFIQLLDSALNPWKGKVFKLDNTGANLWSFRKEFGQYNVLQQNSLVDDKPCLWLDYDVKSNPIFLRNIRGEVRVLDENQFLARMNWLFNNQFYCVTYFSLSNPTADDKGVTP